MEEKIKTRPRQRHVTISPVPITPSPSNYSTITKTFSPWGDSYLDSSYVSEKSVIKRTSSGESIPLWTSAHFLHNDDHFRKIEDHMRAIQKEMQDMIYEHVPKGFKKQVEIEIPTITETNGNKKLEFKFDVKNYKPEEISIKTFENDLTVYAKHESNTNDSKEFREYSRTISLPEEVDPATLSSMLSSDGVLIIQAPISKMLKNEVHILPIEHVKKEETVADVVVDVAADVVADVQEEKNLTSDMSDIESQIIQ